MLTGDVLVHDGLWDVARRDARRVGSGAGTLDFRRILRPVRPLVRTADVAVCHLETPVAPRQGPFLSYPAFSVPPQILGALRATGFDACTTASNHSLDQGFTGLARTLSAMDRSRLAHTGTARDPSERRRLLRLRADGLEIALLSYTFGTNGIPIDADKPWSVNLVDPVRIRADARRAKAAGADAVVVALHWGEEYSHAPSGYQRQIAAQVTRSRDVDLVYGHHAHVVQPVEKVNGTWVAWGLGNFVAEQETDVVGIYEGMVAQFAITRRRDETRVRWTGYRPTYISGYDPRSPDMRVYDIEAELGDDSVGQPLRRQLRAAERRVRSVVGTVPTRRRR